MNTKNIPIPPRKLQLWAGGSEGDDYLQTGEEWAQKIIETTSARGDMKVLEPGCGAGRVARFFVDFLDKEDGGEFVGFDVHSPSIDWATSNISSFANNFRFHTLNIYSDMYNPGFNNPYSTKRYEQWQANVDVWELADPNLGDQRKTSSGELRFPYADNYFDLIYSTSLFTHLTKPYLEKYLQEMCRVSKVGAKIYATFFCVGKGGIEDFAIESVEQGLPDNFEQFDEVSYTLIKTMPSAMMIFEQEYLESVITDTGFRIESSGPGFQVPWIFEKVGSA